MSNLLHFDRRARVEIPKIDIPQNPGRLNADLIEQCLHKALANDADVMCRLFARLIDQHCGNSFQATHRRPGMGQTLDEILMMISLELYDAGLR